MEQNTQNWLNFRKDKIGSSDSPIIMGVSPWNTPYKLWRQKLDLDPPQEETQAMQQGKLREEIARIEFIRRTGIEVIPDVRVSDELPWAMASADGISADGKTLIEIKNPIHAKPECVPDIYMPQLQKQMYVYRLAKMIYFDFTSDFMLEVDRDDDYIENMLEVETVFYDCMQNLVAPTLEKRDYVQRNDTAWLDATEDWLKLYEERKELEKKEQCAREYLIRLAGNSNCKGNGVSVSKIVRKGNIQFKDIPQLKGIDLEQYRGTPIESWRIA